MVVAVVAGAAAAAPLLPASPGPARPTDPTEAAAAETACGPPAPWREARRCHPPEEVDADYGCGSKVWASTTAPTAHTRAMTLNGTAPVSNTAT